jgi:uncharacterized protein DUF1573
MNAILFLALAFAPSENTPLYCAQPVADRGQVRGGPVLAHQFEFSNRAASELAIVHVQPSCGCLAPKLSATRLKPGESATLALSIGTISQPAGDNLWSVRLYYRVAGESENRIAELRVKAKLVKEVSLEPAALRLMGGPGLAHEITLIDRRAKPLDLTGAFPSSNRITATMGDWKKTDAGWMRKIQVKLAENCPPGKHEEIIQILSQDGDYGEIRVPVTVVRHDKQRFLATPEEAKIILTPGKAASAMVLIRDHEGQPIEIAKIEADDPAVTCRFAEGAFPTAAIRVMVAKDAVPARWSTVRVQLKAPIAQSLLIPVSCPNGK